MIRFRKDPDPGNGNGSAARLAAAAAELDRRRARLRELDEQLGQAPALRHSPFDPAGKGERIAARHATARLAEERAAAAAELEQAEGMWLEAGRASVEEEYGAPVRELRQRLESMGPRIEEATRSLAALYGEYQAACEDCTLLRERLRRAKEAVRLRPAEGLTLGPPPVLTGMPFFAELGRLAERAVKDLQQARSGFRPTFLRSPNRLVLPEVRLPGHMQAPPNTMRR